MNESNSRNSRSDVDESFCEKKNKQNNYIFVRSPRRSNLKFIFRFVWPKRPKSVSEQNPFRSRETPNTNHSELRGGENAAYCLRLVRRRTAVFSYTDRWCPVAIDVRHEWQSRRRTRFTFLNPGFVLFKKPRIFYLNRIPRLTWKRRKHKSHRPCAWCVNPFVRSTTTCRRHSRPGDNGRRLANNGRTRSVWNIWTVINRNGF